MTTYLLMGDTSAILLFIKQPDSGKVKSRLAPAIGKDAARALYRNFILDILEAIELTRFPCRLCVHPSQAIPAVAAWLGCHRSYHPQIGSDLGERMEQAFRAIFAENADRAVLIGSDLPDLPAEILHSAMDSLNRHDAVIGPARDGGYYLIGFRSCCFVPGIFRDIAWSGPDVFERTMQEFRKRGTFVHVLPIWQDVDTVADLRDLLERSRKTSFSSSRTIRYLETIRDRLQGLEGFHDEI